MSRVTELLIILFFSPLIIFLLLIISFIFYSFNSKKVLFWSSRIGLNNKIFLMPKFKTMKDNAPNVATHLLENPEIYLTGLGKFLRKYSLDELPQIYSILTGEMSLVGPRPALFNQYDLINLRNTYKINTIKPGITGWAQINGRDEISIKQKVDLDSYYFINRSLKLVV